MEKINWKQKLTSRKFWAALIAVVTTLLVAFNVPNLTIEQVVAVITAASTLVAYIVGEGLVDAARIKAEGEKAIAQNTYALMNASFDQSKWSDAKTAVFNQSIVSSRALDDNELRNKVKNSMDSIALGENDSARGI